MGRLNALLGRHEDGPEATLTASEPMLSGHDGNVRGREQGITSLAAERRDLEAAQEEARAEVSKWSAVLAEKRLALQALDGKEQALRAALNAACLRSAAAVPGVAELERTLLTLQRESTDSACRVAGRRALTRLREAAVTLTEAELVAWLQTARAELGA